MKGEPPSSETHWTSLTSWTPPNTEGKDTEKEGLVISLQEHTERFQMHFCFRQNFVVIVDYQLKQLLDDV